MTPRVPRILTAPAPRDPRPSPGDPRGRDLTRAVSPVRTGDLHNLRFERAEGGYHRAVLGREGEIELVAVRWVAGSASALHGHGDSRVLLRLLSGSLVEYRFEPSGSGYRFRRLALEAGEISFLPSGGYHHVVATAESLAIHAYDPALQQPSPGVPLHDLLRLREALERDFDPAGGAIPAALAAALRRTS